jgi:NADP-dependent aldehyde dehydrogenase
MKTAANRSEPIPVYAEMSSINPIFLLPSALARNAEGLAKGFVDSFTLGVGQFCTNPGLVVGVAGSDFQRFSGAAKKELSSRGSATMLSPGIRTAFQRGIERLKAAESISTVAQVESTEGNCLGSPALFSVEGKDFLTDPELATEVFGPSSILVSCRTTAEIQAVAEQMEGQLTATLFADDEDLGLARDLMPVLERKVGRIIHNGYPTGVEVSWAMVHGGPFPATSDSRTTSVGAGAIDRFLRPISYQNMPAALMPESIQDGNPLKIPRIRDTKIEQQQ